MCSCETNSVVVEIILCRHRCNYCIDDKEHSSLRRFFVDITVTTAQICNCEEDSLCSSLYALRCRQEEGSLCSSLYGARCALYASL